MQRIIEVLSLSEGRSLFLLLVKLRRSRQIIMRQLVANLMIFKRRLLAEQSWLTATFILTILALFQHATCCLSALQLLVEYVLRVKGNLRNRFVDLAWAGLRVELRVQISTYWLSLIGLMEVLIWIYELTVKWQRHAILSLILVEHQTVHEWEERVETERLVVRKLSVRNG